MRTIVYISTAREDLSIEDITALVEQARESNLERHVTGVLLYAGGQFLQILEGRSADLIRLMAKIKTDPRHSPVIVLLERRIFKRKFAYWSMGYYNGPNTEALLKAGAASAIDVLSAWYARETR